MAENKIEYILELDISNWSRGMDAAIRDVRAFDQSLSRAMSSIDEFESKLSAAIKSVPDMEDLDVNMTVDVKEGMFASSITELLGDPGATITTDAREGTVASSIDELLSDPSATITADVDQGSVDTRIESFLSGLSTTITAAIREGMVSSTVEEVLSNPSATVTADVKEGAISPLLETLLISKTAIDLTVNIAGTARNFFDSIADFTFTPIEEMDRALGMIEARTGRMIPQADELINRLYTDNWGESRTEIAEVISLLAQLGVANEDLEEAALSAFRVQSIEGDDLTEVIYAQQRAVEQGLVGSYTEAGDLITRGFQTNINRGGELLEVLNEYGSGFAALGLSGEQAFSLINSMIEGGFKNADLAADSLREFGIRIKEIDNEEVNAVVESLGLAEERMAFLSGDMEGSDFLAQTLTALQGIDDPIERNADIVALFGTQVEDATTEALLLATTSDEAFTNIEGSAKRASDTINDTLGNAFSGLVRTVKTEVSTAFNNAFDIQGKIELVKQKVQEFTGELREGSGFFEALEITLEMPGLTEKLEAFQRGLTEVFLSLLIGLAAVIDAIDKIPTVDVDSEGIRSVVSTLGGEQFKFDLGTSDDMTEFSTAVETAFSRGVDAFDIADSITDKINNMVASGDIESAFSMIDMSQTLIPATSGMIAESLAAELDKAIAAGDPTLAANFARMLGDMGADPEGELRARVEELRAFNDEAELFGGLGFGMETIVAEEERLAKFGVTLREVSQALGTVDGAEHEGLEPAIDRTRQLSEEIEGMEGADETIGETIVELGELETASTTSFGGFFADIQQAATEIEALNTTADTEFDEVTTSIEDTETAVETFSTVSAEQFGKVGDDFTILTDSIETDSARIEYRIDQLLIKWGLLSGMNGGLSDVLIPGGGVGGGGTTNNTNVVQNNTFNNQNGAASAGSGQAAANAIRQP